MFLRLLALTLCLSGIAHSQQKKWSPPRSLLSESSVTPNWIWTSSTDNAPRHFRQSFSFDDPTDTVSLKITSDFAYLEVQLNGQTILELDAFDPVTTLNLTDQLQSGENELRIVATPTGGPSAIAASLSLDGPGGTITLFSEKNWGGESGIEKGKILPERWGENHLPDVSPFAEYNQWKDALSDSSAKSLSPLPPGFNLTTIRAAGNDEDSWVSLAIDSKGRLIVAKEQKGLLRFTLTNQGKEVALVETINDELQECRGLAFRNNALYANANDSKALYRLRDTTGDDLYDEVTLIQSTTGSVGHGRNDLTVGPDGAIHAIHGDSVDTPDRTLFYTAPERDDPKALGHWLTIGPKDAQWTLYTRGLRNPYGIDFNPDGEPFTYDADNEGDVGLPFYRPSRINHLVTGANYGWHQRPGNTRSLPVYAPDSVPTTFDVGRGSPTGVKFGTRSNFPEPWRSALFALDWAYGRIVAVHPVARGGSYYASGEIFLEGRPLNVTDLDFDESGAMLFTTGGRKTRSALYRLSYVPHSDAATSPAPSIQAKERSLFSAEQRSLRRRLEVNLDPVSSESECWNHLGNPDPWIRNAARVRLERRPADEWGETISSTPKGLPRLTALLALVRQGSKEEQTFATETAAALPTESWNRTEKLTLLRIAELGLSSDVSGSARQDLAKRAHSWITSPDASVTRECLRVLSLLDDPNTVERGLLLLTDSQTQSDRLHYLEMLSPVTTGWKEDNRANYFKSLAIARDTSRGDRFMLPFFEAIQRDALAAAPEENRSFLEALLAPREPTESKPATVRAFVKNWTLEDFSSDDFSASAPVAKEKGLALFEAGLCHRCHSFGSEGYPVGPDLAQSGSRFTAEDLLQSILEPSAVVAEVYRNVTLELSDGSEITGRLLRDDFRQSLLYLSTNPFSPTDFTQVEKEKIVRLTESEISPMPPSLLSGFTKKEIISLVNWLLQGPGSD